MPGMSVPELAELGVARISTGSLLYRVAIGAAVDAATAVQGRRARVQRPELRGRQRAGAAACAAFMSSPRSRTSVR